ncbi:MAG TPA: ATP-binding protein [Candidatus Aminicenantes bacterium]|nr:ATP-binding protein [Candidatus Aminicenantes bacterium]HRY65192.1 ATP-binding protein [Candidatus Aminicenantes bacterium]HRZ72340.1 ATP-binding protein [Candidatus Aminicenantes bacterium]
MIEKFSFLAPDMDGSEPRELALLSIISQSFFQPFSLQDNLLVIMTALTSGSGVGFNRAMLFLKEGDRLRGEMWLGPRSAEEAGMIWEVLSTPGIGYVEIIEHNRALVNKSEDTLSARLKGLVYAADDEGALVPAAAAVRKEILHVRGAANDPLVDRRFLNLIGVEEFVCIPLVARDEVVGEIVLDNAITRTPILPADIKLAGICGLMAGNYIYSANLHRKLLDVEKMAAMGEMAMFVTHQLRNPIVAIGGFTDQLLQPNVPEEKRARNLAIIRDEIRRLEDIIFQMGHFLKVSMKEPVYFEPGPAIAAVLENPGVLARSGGYAMNVRLDPCPPEVLCDPTSFGEVLRNLLDNAFDATEAGGTISVRTYRKSPTAFVLSVRDSGRGMSNPDKGQLFKPFFTTKEKGMGLGLPFIKRVMDTCGGKIEVRSRAGAGSLFKLIFVSRERESKP